MPYWGQSKVHPAPSHRCLSAYRTSPTSTTQPLGFPDHRCHRCYKTMPVEPRKRTIHDSSLPSIMKRMWRWTIYPEATLPPLPKDIPIKPVHAKRTRSSAYIVDQSLSLPIIPLAYRTPIMITKTLATFHLTSFLPTRRNYVDKAEDTARVFTLLLFNAL